MFAMSPAERAARQEFLRQRRLKRAAREPVPCTHCTRLTAAPRRGLCYPCTRIPGLLRQQASQVQWGPGAGGKDGEVVPLPEPTPHLPGREEKVRELERRAEMRVELFHKKDAQLDDALLA